MWCIPPKHSAEFVYHMEDVLEVHCRPFDPKRRTRSTAATMKCAKSSSGSQSFRSGGSRNDWSRLNGTNVPIAAFCNTYRAA